MSQVAQDSSQAQLKRTFYFWWNPVFLDKNFGYIYEVLSGLIIKPSYSLAGKFLR